MSKLVVSTLESPAASGIITVAPGDIVYSPGSVIQVIQNHTYSVSATSFPASYTTFTNIPELTASITPKSASSKILIEVRWFGEFNAVGVAWDSMWNLKRGTTLIGRDTWFTDRASGIGGSSTSYTSTDANSTPEMAYFNYLDSPNTTSTITYNGCINCGNQSGTVYTNRTVAAGATSFEHGTSSVTLWEIAQ